MRVPCVSIIFFLLSSSLPHLSFRWHPLSPLLLVPFPFLHLVGPPPLLSQGSPATPTTNAARGPPGSRRPPVQAPAHGDGDPPGVGEARASGSGSPRRPGPRLHRPVEGSYTLAAMEAPPLDLVRPAGPSGRRAGSSLSLRRGRIVPTRSDEAAPFQMVP
jgi:hypothetical protein